MYQAIWKENCTQRERLLFETRKASKITDKILILNGKEMWEKYLKLIVRWRLNTLTSIIFIRGSIPDYAQSWNKGRHRSRLRDKTLVQHAINLIWQVQVHCNVKLSWQRTLILESGCVLNESGVEIFIADLREII